MKNDYTTNGNEQAKKIIYKIAELLGTIIMWLSLVSQRMMYICEYRYSKCLDRFRDCKWLGYGWVCIDKPAMYFPNTTWLLRI